MTTTSRSRYRRLLDEPALDANALELFARIAAAGSFASAARELGLTRAAVSRRIAAIESAVGVALFARSTRSLGLTEAGRRLLGRARQVREAAEGARLALRHQRDQLGGTLRISATPGFGRHVLAPLLSRFRDQHPALRYELFFTERRVDLLREGVDLAFRVTAKPPEDWVAQPVRRFAVRAYGLGPALDDPAALADEPLLLLGQHEEPLLGHWLHQDGRRAEVSMQAASWGSDLEALLAMARSGGGLAPAPDFCVPADDALVDRLPGWRLVVAEGEWVQALTLPVPAASETARALVAFVRAELGTAAPA
ncbi:LysR family transcriptional regulator [Pelomonas sp. SE-A7]|uniref:LysR family transcriptional regulator n=1 Tax=Pelomonas sp. SE-A7 TaxID=3054953 RepID=UPI00259C91AE|nr:LysR family transcriptional regulator [Pelomonas sp. SE-A7]MDM4767796.1 LysR family transcriptional regulator [Pelomonas sp. SE-A7]